MAVKEVKVRINNQDYRLARENGSKYEAVIVSPNITGKYGLELLAKDYAGNVMQADASDPQYTADLILKVIADKQSEDIRGIILTNDLGNRMLDMVAPVYDKSFLMLYLFQALGIVLSKETEFIDGDFISQIFPQTATWGLKEWEYEYGIPTDLSKTLQQRRSYLMSVMFKIRPMIPYRIKQIVKGITGFDCEVIENVEPNGFLVTVDGYYKNTDELKAELDKKTPAHLHYILKMEEKVFMSAAFYTGAAVQMFCRYNMETNVSQAKE